MKVLRGTGVALVTPFDGNKKIDYEGLQRVLEHVESGGIDFLVAMGTTSESPTLTDHEKAEILQFITKRTKLPLVVGHGGNNTQELINGLTNFDKLPIKAILSVTPYYNKPSQAGLIAHFQALANESKWPIILYNVPSRTACNLEASTTLELARHPNICGIKEASGDLKQIREIIKHKPSGFDVWSGNDDQTFEIIKEGGIGVISVIANYRPKEFCDMVNATLDGNMDAASTLNNELEDTYKLLIKEGNPTSVKTALEALGMIRRTVRLPLVEGSDELLKLLK